MSLLTGSLILLLSLSVMFLYATAAALHTVRCFIIFLLSPPLNEKLEKLDWWPRYDWIWYSRGQTLRKHKWIPPDCFFSLSSYYRLSSFRFSLVKASFLFSTLIFLLQVFRFILLPVPESTSSIFHPSCSWSITRRFLCDGDVSPELPLYIVLISVFI